VKVLLDENLPHDLRRHLAGHDVFTVQYLGWSGTKNGELLQRGAEAGFDVLVTLDNGVTYQQNITILPLSLVILSAASNDFDDLKPLIPALLQCLESLRPKTIQRVMSTP
jgi:hypothetical protein